MSYSDSEFDSEEVEEEEKISPEGKKTEEFINAIKNGLVKRVREIVEKEGDEIVCRRDAKGHFPIHWAALGGFNGLIEYFLEKGATLNDHSLNDYGPRPIHWACVNGHVVTVDLFLEKGVHIDTTDLNGCSPLLIASQYGQSLVVSYLLQKGSNKFHSDINGDTALHWAAFKGYPEVVFLLLNAGLSPTQKDTYSQTPMHSCCIKGDIQVAEMLLDHGAAIDDPDSNEKSPRDLAEKRKHYRLVQFLDNRDIPTSYCDWRTWVFGPPGRSRISLLIYICCILLWGYPMYYWMAVPYTLTLIPGVHRLFWIGNVIMWTLFFWLKCSDPGYIQPNEPAFREAQKMIGNPGSWGEYNDFHNPVYNMCHTCKTIRPVRGKHCRQCDKCVDHFDHHCPWIDHCVGYNNRVQFFLFVNVLFFNGILSVIMSYYIRREVGGALIWIGMIALALFSLPIMVTGGYNWMLLFANMTTNERANYRRYRHFRDVHDNFRNPFFRGFLMNVLEYFHIVQAPYIKKRSKSFVA